MKTLFRTVITLLVATCAFGHPVSITPASTENS
jgi:hypothetical protein